MTPTNEANGGIMMKGYVNGEGYMGYVNGNYMLFASEEDYWEYMEDGSEI